MFKYINTNLLIAVPGVSKTLTVIFVDNGLLNWSSIGGGGTLALLISNDDLLKYTVAVVATK